MGLGCDYTLCDYLPALPDWLSGESDGDCVAVVHEGGEGDEGVTMVSLGSRGVVRLDFAGEQRVHLEEVVNQAGLQRRSAVMEEYSQQPLAPAVLDQPRNSHCR